MCFSYRKQLLIHDGYMSLTCQYGWSCDCGNHRNYRDVNNIGTDFTMWSMFTKSWSHPTQEFHNDVFFLDLMIYHHWNFHVIKIRASVCTLSRKSFYSCEQRHSYERCTYAKRNLPISVYQLSGKRWSGLHTHTHTLSISSCGKQLLRPWGDVMTDSN